MLARHLASRGHDVVWWTSAFDHTQKAHLATENAEIQWEGVTLRLVRALGYKRNVSLARVIDHALVAHRFERLANSAVPPDIILASMPTIDLAQAATRVGERFAIPAVIDIRDLWPDVYLELVPSFVRFAASIAIKLPRRQVRNTCRRAYAITGNAPNFVEWGLKLAERPPGRFDRFFPFGYSVPEVSESRRAAAREYWRSHGLTRGHDDLIGCYLGAIGHQSDFETVIEAARLLAGSAVKFRMIFCGTGDRLDGLREQARDIPEVVFAGWVEQPEILELMAIAQFGIAPYWNHSGYIGNLPNKPIEYLAGGLPVVTCLSGFLKDFITSHECGFWYQAQDPMGLVRLVRDLDENREKLERASVNARRVFDASFDAPVVYSAMVDYLEDIVRHTSKQRPEGSH